MTKRKLKRQNYILQNPDFPLLLTALALVTVGVIMVFSASYYKAIDTTGQRYSYLIDELKWVGIGMVALFLARHIDYHIYKKLAPIIVVFSFVLLFLLFTPLAKSGHGAARWIEVGSITIMPGELAKPAAIVGTAAFLSDKPQRIKSLFDGILPLLILAGAYAILIIKQPNLSTAITVVLIIVGIMFAAGLNFFYLIGAGGIGALGVMTLILANPDSHWAERISSFADPFAYSDDSGWQVVQSLLAMGTGGIFGLGLGKSVQKNLYLPEAQNDFIFAIMGEELGLFGCTLLIILYIILLYKIAKIAINARDLFGSLCAIGIGVMVGAQVILNIAVVTSSMPATGVALPFVSYGGNALLIFMGCTGILLNISTQRAAEEFKEDLDPIKKNKKYRRIR